MWFICIELIRFRKWIWSRIDLCVWIFLILGILNFCLGLVGIPLNLHSTDSPQVYGFNSIELITFQEINQNRIHVTENFERANWVLGKFLNVLFKGCFPFPYCVYIDLSLCRWGNGTEHFIVCLFVLSLVWIVPFFSIECLG